MTVPGALLIYLAADVRLPGIAECFFALPPFCVIPVELWIWENGAEHFGPQVHINVPRPFETYVLCIHTYVKKVLKEAFLFVVRARAGGRTTRIGIGLHFGWR